METSNNKPELIVMLTYHDLTVPNALELFERLKDKPVRYYPFPGRVYGHPSLLDGTIEEIAAHARGLEAQGAHGMDLLTYRYTGDAPRLLREVPIVSAGSLASHERIGEVWRAGAWGFTIGSAFFESKFVPDGGFEDNLMAVADWLQRQ